MPLIYMIRHGEAASGWDADMDPGLSEKGRAQAESAGELTRALPAGLSQGMLELRYSAE